MNVEGGGGRHVEGKKGLNISLIFENRCASIFFFIRTKANKKKGWQLFPSYALLTRFWESIRRKEGGGNKLAHCRREGREAFLLQASRSTYNWPYRC